MAKDNIISCSEKFGSETYVIERKLVTTLTSTNMTGRCPHAIVVTFLFILTVVENSKASICKLPRDEGWFCYGAQIEESFYFDSISKECKSFTFSGCGGNSNRFKTLGDCRRSCGPNECPIGSPLTDQIGVVQKCVRGALNCPPGFDCVGTGVSDGLLEMAICCPNKETVCHHSVDRGSRCLGAPVTTRFFYDPMAKICREFTFLGCGGNNNNFITRGECLKLCVDQIICLKGDPLPQQASTHLRECDAANPCPSDGDYECIRQGRESACCPSRKNVCRQRFDVGVYTGNTARTRRWYFNANASQCEEFEFLGSRGNLNNFANSEQCQSYCMAGADAYISPVTRQLQKCKPAGGEAGTHDSCPVEHVCSLTSLGTYLCCKVPPRCPMESQPYIDIITGTTITCQPGLSRHRTCPEGFACTKGQTKVHICCTEAIECPNGFSILRDSIESGPHFCTVGVEGTCPSAYACTKVSGASSGVREVFVCCKAQKICILPYVDPVTHFALNCGSNADCPPGTSCLTNSNDRKTYCCHDIEYSLCPDASIPYFEPSALVPKRCVNATSGAQTQLASSNRVHCTMNFYCAILEDQTFGCCRQPMIDQICQIAYLDPKTGSVIPCVKDAASTGVRDVCPGGTLCRRASNGRYYCCER